MCSSIFPILKLDAKSDKMLNSALYFTFHFTLVDFDNTYSQLQVFFTTTKVFWNIVVPILTKLCKIIMFY